MISTFGERIKNVKDVLLPPMDGIEYVVSWQRNSLTFDIPKALKRNDVRVSIHDDKGISANRNHALGMVKTPYAIIADDDVRYSENDLKEVIKIVKNNPEIDIFCFRIKINSGGWLKLYPEERYNYLRQPRGAYVTSCELLLKMSNILPLFDEHYGIGNPYLGCGEEEIFLIDAAHRGLRIEYFPVCITAFADDQTTGKRFLHDASIQRAKGAVLYRRYGFILSVFKTIKTTICLQTKINNKIDIFNEMIKGVYYGWKFSI